MNQRGKSFSACIVAAAFTGALISGCVVTAVPDRVPLQKGMLQQNLAGVSLVVMSASPGCLSLPDSDRSGRRRRVRGRSAGMVVKKLAEALAGELARKGASLRSTASLKLSVEVTEITLVQTGEAQPVQGEDIGIDLRGMDERLRSIGGDHDRFLRDRGRHVAPARRPVPCRNYQDYAGRQSIPGTAWKSATLKPRG